MLNKIIFLVTLVFFQISCKGNYKKLDISVLYNKKTLVLKVVNYRNKVSFKLYKGKVLINHLQETLSENCGSIENSCGVNYIRGSFQVADLNNDTHSEVIYLYHKYLDKTEQTPKDLKIVLFDTKDNKRYFLCGTGVNKFDELTLDKPKGHITKRSDSIPNYFSKKLESLWGKYSFEHKIPNKGLHENVIIIDSLQQNILAKRSIKSSTHKFSAIKKANFEGEEKEYFNIHLGNGKVLKFKNPAFQISYHYISIEEDSILIIKNIDNNRSFVETFWYYSNDQKALKMFRAYAESYDKGKTTRYRLENLDYNIKEIDSDIFFDEIYNSKNKI